MITDKPDHPVVTVTKAIIALGSNLSDKADIQRAFTITHHALNQLGDICVSSVVVGQDFTGKTAHIYHNWVVRVDLYQALTHQTLNTTLKDIEYACGRDAHAVLVPMDLDLLAYYDDGWVTIKKRLPFKAHEKKGLIQVAPFLLDLS